MEPRRISILGVGLLGGSIALASRRRIKDCRITGYAHRSETLAAALRLGILHDGSCDPVATVADADLVILCSPVGTFPALLSAIAPRLRPGTLVSDVGSTKRSVVFTAERLLPPGVHFV